MKVVITGASGLLGRALVKEFKEKGFTVFGFVKSRVSEGLLSVDLLDGDAVRSQLTRLAPDVIVHSAACRFPNQVDGDPDNARRVNVQSTGLIASLAAELKSHLVYISTDYVFDGENPPFKSDSPTNPINLYGQTKRDGEVETLKHCPGAMVLRVPVLYGPLEYLAESAVTVLLGCLLEPPQGGSTVSDREVRCPSHVQDISSVCRQLVEKRCQNEAGVSGIYQWSGQEALTKYGMVREMAALFRLPVQHVRPSRVPPPDGVPRPIDCRMDTARLQELGVAANTPFQQGVYECLLPWVEKHRAGKAAGE